MDWFTALHCGQATMFMTYEVNSAYINLFSPRILNLKIKWPPCRLPNLGDPRNLPAHPGHNNWSLPYRSHVSNCILFPVPLDLLKEHVASRLIPLLWFLFCWENKKIFYTYFKKLFLMLNKNINLIILSILVYNFCFGENCDWNRINSNRIWIRFGLSE